MRVSSDSKAESRRTWSSFGRRRLARVSSLLEPELSVVEAEHLSQQLPVEVVRGRMLVLPARVP